MHNIKDEQISIQNIMLTSFCDMTLHTLADRYQPSSGSTGNCPYTCCCTFSKQIPNIFQAHWYQHLHFPSSYSGMYTSIFIHFLPHLSIVTFFHSQNSHQFPTVPSQPILICHSQYYVPLFHHRVQYSTLKMTAACSSKTMVSIYHTT